MNTFQIISPEIPAGLTLEVAITVATLKRVKARLALDLASLEEGDPPLLARLSVDPLLICDTLYVVCQPQLDAAGLTDEQFGQAMGGEAIFAGQEALFEALTDFFQHLGRTEMVRMIRAQATLTKAAITAGAAKIDREAEKFATQIPSMFGAGSTSSPESADSTPAPSRSANSSGWPTENAATNGTAPP